MNNFKEQFDELQAIQQDSAMSNIREDAFNTFNNLGFPTSRNEEWKYTRIAPAFNKEFSLAKSDDSFAKANIEAVRLPGHENANELVFINGIYSEAFSTIRSADLKVQNLEAASANEYKDIVATHFNHSSKYIKDGIGALNTAFMHGGVFVYVPKGKAIEQPVYIYNITDATDNAVCAQPRSLFYVCEAAELSIVETYKTIGASDSMTNQVMEMIVEQAANVYYCKIQNDSSQASQVSTTHIRQIGLCNTEAVTISLNGGIVRNNLNFAMEAANSEAHMYGLYFQSGNSHIDNHTIVDNIAPGCQSNELYKGIMNDTSTGVFNGRIYVRKDAQKTNAFQSNKNILLGELSSVNTQPQLEIFADDVKCSHGCTVGSLDQEAIFYLQSRGIPKENATSLLLQGFAIDVVEKIRVEAIRNYVDELISARLIPA